MNNEILIVEDEFIIARDLEVILKRAGYRVAGIADSVENALDLLKDNRPAFVFLDIKLRGPHTGIDLAIYLNEVEIPFIFVSANCHQAFLELAKSTKPYGFLVKPFRDNDVLVTLDIAIYRHQNNLESKIVRELKLQTDISEILKGRTGRDDKLLHVLAAFQKHIPFDLVEVCYFDVGHGAYHFIAAAKNDTPGDQMRREANRYRLISMEALAAIFGKSLEELSDDIKPPYPGNQPRDYSGQAFADITRGNTIRSLLSETYQLASALTIPLNLDTDNGTIWTFYLSVPNKYQLEHTVLIDRLHSTLLKISDSIIKRASQLETVAIHGTRNQKGERKTSEEARIRENQLIGSSSSLLAIKRQISIVAPFDISVLILGESGTGKERVAQSIHELSTRKSSPFIRINCAAIPATLMESELFGHESGAFTGATGLRIGKFELAIGGSIFLDEIGELSFDLQSKLLSVLQEKEIVRLGSNHVIKADVRIIAATNRNLEQQVAEGRFRLDLYYRLKAFQIDMPALRERKEDLADLVPYFLARTSKKLNKKISGISDEMLAVLMMYDWPGNVRELENLIERSALLATGEILAEIDLPDARSYEPVASDLSGPLKTMKEAEKDHILTALKKCNHKINGPAGAAALLDMAPTSLLARMNKLGITKKYIID